MNKGDLFGRLTVIEKDIANTSTKNSKWICKCSCGKTISVSRPNLRRGWTRSCGCISSPSDKEYLTTQEVRFFKFTEKTSSCWVWKGSIDKQGYGNFNNRTKTIKAHRYAYSRFVKPLVGGQIICHTCDNRACVNPDHLYQGTHKDNMKDLSQRKGWGKPRKRYSDKKKEAIKILYDRGLSVYEIAELLNISATGVLRYAK